MSGVMGMILHGKHTGCGRGTCSSEVSDVREKERSRLRGPITLRRGRNAETAAPSVPICRPGHARRCLHRTAHNMDRSAVSSSGCARCRAPAQVPPRWGRHRSNPNAPLRGRARCEPVPTDRGYGAVAGTRRPHPPGFRGRRASNVFSFFRCGATSAGGSECRSAISATSSNGAVVAASSFEFEDLGRRPIRVSKAGRAFHLRDHRIEGVILMVR